MNKVQKIANVIEEKEALLNLIQIYISHSSKWYSALITTLVGSIGFPLLSFSLNLSVENGLTLLSKFAFTLIVIPFLKEKSGDQAMLVPPSMRVAA